MGEARRKRMQRRADKDISRLDFSKIEQRLLGQGHKPDYLEREKDDVLIMAHPVSNNPRHFAHIEPPKDYVEDLLLRSQTEDKPHTKTHTPAALWREKGEPDPHGNYYDTRERHEIMGGQFSDDEIAFKCGMASGRDLESISTLHLAKERIRWLSRKLVAAEKRIAELERKK